MHMKYKKTKSETVNTSDNMTPPSVMPQGTPPAKPDGEVTVVLLLMVLPAAHQAVLQVMMP